MEYICHRRYDKVGASGKRYIIRRKEKLETIGPYIAMGAEGVCAIRSEDAHRHFSRNDDGCGLERGKLTWGIAYAPRHPNKDNGFRFTDEEREMLSKEYERFLREDADMLLFNDDFFNADIEELRDLAKRLEVV